MSFEDVWALPEGPLPLDDLKEALTRLAASVPIDTSLVQRTGAVDVKLRVPREKVLEVLRRLDPGSFVFQLDAEKLAQELEPPWDEAATHYRLTFTLYDGDEDGGPAMCVYSNESDNRRVWAVAHALFRTLATALRAEPLEESAEEAMGWDPSAILKPKN